MSKRPGAAGFMRSESAARPPFRFPAVVLDIAFAARRLLPRPILTAIMRRDEVYDQPIVFEADRRYFYILCQRRVLIWIPV